MRNGGLGEMQQKIIMYDDDATELLKEIRKYRTLLRTHKNSIKTIEEKLKGLFTKYKTSRGQECLN